MRMLALDCATTTGWAACDDIGIRSGTANFALKRGETAGIRFMKFNAWLDTQAERLLPEVCVYEQSHHRGGAATDVGVGFTTRVQEMGARHGIECCPVHTAALKKFATGRGNASKPEMQARAAELFPHYDPEKDPGADEADALLLLHWGMENLRGG